MNTILKSNNHIWVDNNLNFQRATILQDSYYEALFIIKYNHVSKSKYWSSTFDIEHKLTTSIRKLSTSKVGKTK